MSETPQQFSLTPQERRIVVVIGVVVFIVLNMLLVWPHFKDLARVRQQLNDTRETIRKYNADIAQDVEPVKGYRKTLADLQKQQGGGVVNQQIALQKSISEQALKTGVNVTDMRPSASLQKETNAFYDEQDIRIGLDSTEEQLINFLYNVGNDPAMIRVRELNLHPADANRYRLRGEALLSANYSKQPVAAAPAKAAPAKAPATPAAPPGPPSMPHGHGPSQNPAMKPTPNLNRAPNAVPGRKNL